MDKRIERLKVIIKNDFTVGMQDIAIFPLIADNNLLLRADTDKISQ